MSSHIHCCFIFIFIYFSLTSCANEIINSETKVSRNTAEERQSVVQSCNGSDNGNNNGQFTATSPILPVTNSSSDVTKMTKPPKFLLDLYQNNIRYKGGSALEGAARILSVVLRNANQRQDSVHLTFDNPRLQKVRSVRLVLTKHPGHLDSLCNRLMISASTGGAQESKVSRIRSLLTSNDYGMFDVTDLMHAKRSTDDHDQEPVNTTLTIHGCCCKRDRPLISEVYQLQEESADSPTMLFYDDEKQTFWGHVNAHLLDRISDHRERRTRSSRRPVGDKRWTPCKLRHWELHVDDIGWGNFVYLPTTFQVNFCRGKCRFLMNNDVKTTLHSLVKSKYLNFRGSRRPSTPPRVTWSSCVPNGFRNVSVMYLFEGTFTIAGWDDLEAVSCGCA